MKRSGWTNPEGWKPAPRSSEPAPAVQACEAAGPGGWTCDLKPGHEPAADHWADNGEAGGMRWRETKIDASVVGDAEPVYVPGPLERLATVSPEVIAELVSRGLNSPNPGHWYTALTEIQELLHG